MAVRTSFPRHSISFGSPTFTERSLGIGPQLGTACTELENREISPSEIVGRVRTASRRAVHGIAPIIATLHTRHHVTRPRAECSEAEDMTAPGTEGIIPVASNSSLIWWHFKSNPSRCMGPTVARNGVLRSLTH